MRRVLLSLLSCLALGGCPAHGVRCEGPFQPINAEQRAGAVAPSSTDHRGVMP